jgi:RND family efflux transporter MFP subunit
MSLLYDAVRYIATRSAFMRLILLAGLLPLALAACNARPPAEAAAPPPWVRTAAVSPVAAGGYGASGTVRSRIESPLSFQVPGRIVARLVDANQTVAAGQPLMRLDERDLEQAVQAASAELAAAQAALATVEADLARNRELQQRNFLSAQAVERTELQRREAQSRRDAAAARLAQARNARGYAVLNSPAAGVLLEVTGEPGQVVAAGQPVAVLAQGTAREIEVFLPEQLPPPKQGQALLSDGRMLALRLREVAGAVEPQGRTRRARYTVGEGGTALVLGAVVRTRFEGVPVAAPGTAGAQAVFTVPIGALDERGQGPRVWRVREGRLTPTPVQVLVVDDRHAQVSGALAVGERVVALGTQLLREDMTVRELPR